ncbi:hypothetical protein ACHAPT_009793 [Fusarium lateritium]
MFKNKSQPVSTTHHDTDPSSDEESDMPFVGEQEDPLIPSASDAFRTFRDGEATWDALFKQARNMPKGHWPTGMLDPYIALMNVPSLPRRLPSSRILYGRPRWDFSPDVVGRNQAGQDDDYPTLRCGRRLAFFLLAEEPIRSSICLGAASSSMGLDSETTDSLAVLTMCWSYILSVRVLEKQGRQVCYTRHHLTPQREARPMIDLEGASHPLVRWLCAILSPEFGWGAKDEGKLPMFATFLSRGTRITMTGARVRTTGEYSAPSSSEAMELLIELCRLYRLGTCPADESEWVVMPSYRAGFLAALMLPFYTFMDLHPQLPTPYLAGPPQDDFTRHLARPHRGVFDRLHEGEIRRYCDDLGYFMTLGSHPPSVGSTLWSIFWQPEVDCNLAGPWLTSILEVLKPAIRQKHVEAVLKTFVARRPRVAIWWIALFLLGDMTILDCIQRYTQKSEEKPGVGSMTAPDPIAAAWTGAKQSFLDVEKDVTYAEPSDLVSRADVLRCRFDVKLQDYESVLLSWRPFGYLQKEQVEVDIWRHLETKYVRKYHSFVWYPDRNSNPTALAEHGFRHDTGRDVKNVPDNLSRHSTSMVQRGGHQPPLSIRPSRVSTRQMMTFLVEDTVGSRDWVNAVLPVEEYQLRWLFRWYNPGSLEGNSSCDGLEEGGGNIESASWFVREWLDVREGFDERRAEEGRDDQ